MNIKKILVSGISAAMILGTFSVNAAARTWNPENTSPKNEPGQELKRPHEGIKIHGTVNKVEDNCIYLRLSSNKEIKVNLSSETKYYEFRNSAEKKALTAGKFVVITPANGEKITDDTKEITALDISIRPPVIKGTVSSVQDSEIIIRLDDGSTKKLITNKETRIFMKPTETYTGKITPGMKLSALVDSINDVMQAKVIKIHEKQ